MSWATTLDVPAPDLGAVDLPPVSAGEGPELCLRVHGAGADWASMGRRVGELRAAGVASIEVEDAIRPGSPATAGFLAVLREARSERIAVRWRLEEADAGWWSDLVHLTPPVEGAGDWQAAHAGAICFWRRGPGYATVSDRRPTWSTPRTYRISGGHLELFERAAVPIAADDLAADEAPAAAELVDARLIRIEGGALVALPPRMRRWPIPHDAL